MLRGPRSVVAVTQRVVTGLTPGTMSIALYVLIQVLKVYQKLCICHLLWQDADGYQTSEAIAEV